MKSTIETNREFQERMWRQQKIGDALFRLIFIGVLVAVGVYLFKLGVALGG